MVYVHDWYSIIPLLNTYSYFLTLDGSFPTIPCEYNMKDTDDYEEQIVGCNGIRDMVITEGGRACYDQIIYNDLSLERTEYTGLKLTARDSTALTDVSEDYGHATIKILDDEGWSCVYSHVAVLYCVCVGGGGH